MAESLSAQIEKLRRSISGLEAQRAALGDDIVSPALLALQQQLIGLETQIAAQAAPIEERRMVTILFIDMVGSTNIAEKLDPEEWRQIVSQIHATLGKVITDHRGTINQYLGDGLLAIFDTKEASEQEPENAIRAALDGLAAFNNLPQPERIQLRAGVHTGLVVIGELGDVSHKEITASGDAMNMAARLQAAAPAGGILISQDTYRYIRGVFDLTPRPPLIVKGKGEPIQTYLVRRAKPRPFRSVARGVAGVETPTIGRDAEMQALQSAYLQAYQGHGMVWAQLLSDPGMGKSRLLEDLSEWIDLRDEPVTLLRARAFPDDDNLPFALVRRMWFDRFQIAEDAPMKQAETKWVERFIELCGESGCDEAAHALGHLVGLPFSTSAHIKAMQNDPNQVKGRALVVSRELLRAIRVRSTTVVLLEDLQWCDPASWEYLAGVFLDQSNSDQPHGLFILGTARPEWHPAQELRDIFESSELADHDMVWGQQIFLAPLTDQATRQLASELLEQVEDVPAQAIDFLVERSEGVPYFTEELINWLIDHEIVDTQCEPWRFLSEKFNEQPLPATLQHLLLTRLSNLSPTERATLQRGAIFGRHFWTGGVEALGIQDGKETLERLQPRGFVEAQPESAFEGDKEWSFHHNLLHEVAYESVLKRERLELHKLAATWLEQQAGQAGRLDEFAGLLGEHHQRANELSIAAEWYLRAGIHAYSQGAPRSAKGFFTQALELLPPVEKEKRWQALLGREEALGVLGEAEAWKADTTALVELAHAFDDDNYLAEAYIRQAICGMRAGELAISDQAAHEALAAAHRSGNEPSEAKALSLIAVVYVNKGDKLRSIEYIEEALSKARNLNELSVLSFVLFRAAFCYGELGDMARLIPLQTEQIELDHRLGNLSQEVTGMANLSGSYIFLGLYKQARTILEQAREASEALDAHRTTAYILGDLGELYLATGDYRKARQMLDLSIRDILPTQDVRGKIFGLNDLGELLVRMGDATGASARFGEASDLAIKLGSYAFACEAKAGLGSCAVMQGKLDEARKYVQETWTYLQENGGVGMGFPGRVYLHCIEIFDALGEVENYQVAIEAGHKRIIDIAEKISVPDWRRSFLENNPYSRAIMEMWERRSQ